MNWIRKAVQEQLTDPGIARMQQMTQDSSNVFIEHILLQKFLSWSQLKIVHAEQRSHVALFIQTKTKNVFPNVQLAEPHGIN